MNNLPNRIGSSEVAGILRNEIESGTFVTHDRLPSERVLAQTYKVARGTIREALGQLESQGFVDVRAGSGTYISQTPIELTNPVVANARPLELIDARFALEPHICRLAVLHARNQDFDRAELLLTQMEANAGDSHAFSAADTAFHNLLAESTGNNLLIWVVGQISSVRNQEQWSRMLHLTLNDTIIAQYNIQHRQILDAIRSREPERAANLMKGHLEAARLSLTRSAAT